MQANSLGTVLVCAPLAEEALALLREKATVRHVRPQTREALMAALGPEVSALVMGVHPFVDGEMMDRAPNLQAIGRKGVGVDNIDLEAARQRGIYVLNTPLAPVEPVAELALGLMIALARSVVQLDRATRQGAWDERLRRRGPELLGKTLGLVGFGRIGRRVAELVQPLRMRVLYYDVRRYPEAEARLGATAVPLPTLFREADWVSVHVPLTEQTRHLVGRDLLALMKPTAYLLNLARGPVVDEEALAEALREGRIAGAALDVFSCEPLGEEHPLCALDKVILTPHIGGLSLEGEVAMSMVVRDVLAVLEGREPEHAVVRPERPGGQS
ncbi:MAG: hydroxyacid dehydrogenase [Anaerolineae bacterium]|nr:hydroxyacid dehydrogenase [Anaerolineae bacterium]